MNIHRIINKRCYNNLRSSLSTITERFLKSSREEDEEEENVSTAFTFVGAIYLG